MYSILWKNGDLGKERHIIAGIENYDPTSNGTVFHQFGRYLSNKKEPIIDQHTIRAYKIYIGADVEECCKIKAIGNKDTNIVNQYKDWVKNLKKPNLQYEIDKIIFATGKYAKSEFKRIRKVSSGEAV
jgi:hypothetical protein